MADNDELSAPKLTSLLKEKYPELADVSLSTVKRAGRELGWVAKKTRYCALISGANQEKRLEWCKERRPDGGIKSRTRSTNACGSSAYQWFVYSTLGIRLQAAQHNSGVTTPNVEI